MNMYIQYIVFILCMLTNTLSRYSVFVNIHIKHIYQIIPCVQLLEVHHCYSYRYLAAWSIGTCADSHRQILYHFSLNLLILA